jgi:hypothetical protein
MIMVCVSGACSQEKHYIIHVVFNEFLGLEYQLETSNNVQDYEITFANKKLIIRDHFFNKYKGGNYLDQQNIPGQVAYLSNQFIPEQNVPVIYGNDELMVSSNEIVCGIDIFASSFFMLSRWEEYVNKTRDQHDRFPATASLAYKYNFLSRPVVNEYVETLKNMLLELNNDLVFRKHSSKTFISCDVDQPFDCTVENLKNLIRVGAGDILKRKSIKEFAKRVRRFICNKFENYSYDENYTFDWYIGVCEKAKIKAAFYFIPTSVETQNGCYELKDNKIKKLIKYINSRGHELGVHGSYQTYQDKEKAKKQKDMLDAVLDSLDIPQKVVGNRQHYLRWDSAVTPSVLEYAGFEYDTTGSYADRPGFRYGVCYEFSMFDILNNCKLNMKQRPLIVMECSVIDKPYMGLGYSEDALQTMRDLKQKCFKYKGNFSLLWHNSSFKNIEDKKMFEDIINV